MYKRQVPGEILRIHKHAIWEIPENVKYEEAAVLDPICNSYKAIAQQAHLLPGQDVVVFGTGPLGLFAVQVARIMGAVNIVMVGLEEDTKVRFAVAKELGATHVVNGSKEDVVKRCTEICGRDNLGLVVECSGCLLYTSALHRDDKVILSWNSWMIIAMAKAAQILDDARFQNAAEDTYRFIRESMTDSSRRLFHRWREGEAAIAGQLDDYAVYGLALLELYRMTYEPIYLEEAEFFARQMTELFEDKENGGCLLYTSRCV